ncbi:hypothetical protein GOP47_0008070 [Adiantum capillus-veneris]|uniref:AAA+ ATPase domain-containing protein n=1 Tax=Adiantum capillus-veneris TaxID=13818 RepID=A0A9D4UXJ0_ADICA|nr:hypothetical protein GOP47_0008070 [Adiantum capillus-veneris]
MEKTWISMGAIFAFLGFIQGLLNTFMPHELSFACKRLGVRIYNAIFSSYVDYAVEEYDGTKLNELYDAAQLHLSDKAARSARRLSLIQPKNASVLTCSLGEHERVVDVYEGSQIWWEFSSSERKQSMTISWQTMPDKRRSLHMRIHRKDREKIMSGYLPSLLENAKALQLKRRDRLLYTNVSHDPRGRRKPWDSVPFKHPATFHSLALEPALKQKIMDDLTDFANGEQFYKDVGRAWKRGYLLYGPPGTGKSTMIAAMANFLEYDVYDLELTEVKSNAELRSLLLNTSNKAIIVLEDIDCSLDLSERKRKKAKKPDAENEEKMLGLAEREEKVSEVTLSGLLNFTDGLWSSCGSERIFVFTTNHIEKLDAALLRSGRMDMHIHLSYCGFEAFKVLARNYLKLEDHVLFEKVRAAMDEEGVQMTPADVSEVMTRDKRDTEQALRSLIKELRESKVKRRDGEQKEEGANEGTEEKQEVVPKEADVQCGVQKENAKVCEDAGNEVDINQEAAQEKIIH